MFGKLLKNDLKIQFHGMYVLLFIVLVITAVAELAALFAKLGNWQNAGLIRAIGGTLAWVVLLFACFVIVGAVGVSFSKTVFGRSGYLTLTLPVKTSSLVRSKTLSGLIWVWLVYVAFLTSLFLWMMEMQDVIGEGTISAAGGVLQALGLPSFRMLGYSIGGLLVYLLAFVFLLVQCLYFGITLANVRPFSKLGGFGAVLYFLIVFGILTGIAQAFGRMLPIGFVGTESGLVFTSDVALSAAGAGVVVVRRTMDIVFEIVFAVLLHFPMTYLINKKVNVA